MKITCRIAGLVCLCSLLMFPSCNKSPVTVPLGNWVHSGDFQGVPRSGAFCFTIGNKAYIGMGYNGSTSALHYLRDGYVYDQGTGIWSIIAQFPGEPRERAVAFSIDGKGYVGTGYNRDSLDIKYAQLKDFWEYDPATDQWKQLNDFGGAARYNAIGFADINYGYVGTGYDGTYYGDLWRYDPTVDSWTPIQSYQGTKRQQATIMPIGGKFYLLSGFNNGSFVLDSWKFDPEEQDPEKRWSTITPAITDAQYANFKAAVGRYDAVAFEMNGFGYIATGSTGPAQNSTYQYDPVGLTWTKMTPFERAPRSQAVAFVVGSRVYLGTGVNGSTRFDDMMEFQPTAEVNANDNN